MFDKIAEILGNLNAIVLMAAALGIVAIVFVVGLVFSFGGDLGKFKKVAKKVIAAPTLANCNATAKELPIRARKQYKTVKQTGCKPDDAITPDACVYAPFKESVAAHLPGAVMAAGVLSILLSFFACGFVKDANENILIVPVVVTVGVMIFRLAAGLVSSAIIKGGMKAYNGYVTALAKVLTGGGAEASEPTVAYARQSVAEESEPRAYDATFDAPERITVELADEENEVRTVEPVVEPVVEATPVVEASAESEAELKARARAEAMAAARAEQAAAQAAAQQAAAQPQAAAQQAAQPQPEPAAQPQAAAQTAASSADEVIARIAAIQRDGAPINTMKEVALALQKERAKPENKTPEMQRKLNEALAGLLKAMSSANKK